MALSTPASIAVATCGGIVAFGLIVIAWYMARRCRPARPSPKTAVYLRRDSSGLYHRQLKDTAGARSQPNAAAPLPRRRDAPAFPVPKLLARFPTQHGHAAPTAYPEPWFASSSAFVNRREPQYLPSHPDYPTNLSGNESGAGSDAEDDELHLGLSLKSGRHSGRRQAVVGQTFRESPLLRQLVRPVPPSMAPLRDGSSVPSHVDGHQNRKGAGDNVRECRISPSPSSAHNSPSVLHKVRHDSLAIRHAHARNFIIFSDSDCEPLDHESPDSAMPVAYDAQSLRHQLSFPEPDSLAYCGLHGVLNFGLRFLAMDQRLEVAVHSARCLPAGTVSPFVEVKMLKTVKRTYAGSWRRPGRRASPLDISPLSASVPNLDTLSPGQRSSGLDFDPCNPFFDQLLVLDDTDVNQLTKGTIRLSVRDEGVKKSDQRIGKVWLAFDGLDLGADWHTYSMSLERNTVFLAKPEAPRGELVVGIQFSSDCSKLRCRVLRAQSLPRPISGNPYDAYVSIRLMKGTEELSRTSSSPVRCGEIGTADFDYEVHLNLRGLERDRVHVVFSVKARFSVIKRKSYEVGKLMLGAQVSGDTQQRHWVDAQGAKESVGTHLLHA